MQLCVAIAVAFDAKPHALPAYDNSAIAPERRLNGRAEFAIGDPEIDAGIDAPEGAPLFSCGRDHGSSLLKAFAGRPVGLNYD